MVIKTVVNLERFEVFKGNKSFYFTGILSKSDEEGWMVINTIKAEVLKFRTEQILQREEIVIPFIRLHHDCIDEVKKGM